VAVLQRKELESSPLADLHAIAAELGLEGFRTLRKDDLIAAILQAQGGEEELAEEAEAPEPSDQGPEPEPEETVSGVLDILPNGSGFLRVDPSGQSRDDIYVSPAQIRRCELRAGDEVAGPMRPARRGERHPSLVRVETVNGADAEPPEERPHFAELTPVFPSDRLAAPDELAQVPFGKGSRVAIGGPPGAGASRLLREIAAVLADRHPEVELAVALAGVRPEEVGEWRANAPGPVYGGSFDRSPDAQAQAAELAVERGKRAVERGRDAALVVDTLEGLPPGAARRVFGAARKAREGGSLTVIAATGMSWEPQRWATTRVALDPLAEDGPPKVSAMRSGALRAELLG
jgi:transcription termination factor Rho